MFLNQLTRQIENWKGDLKPFIVVPCSGEALSRAEIHGLIKSCQNIFSDLVSSTKDHRPSVGFYFEDPISYIVATLASRFVDVVVVPIPKEFTLNQVSSFTPHLDFVLTDSEEGHQKISTILKNKKDEAQKL